MSVKLIIVDDHQMFREGLVNLLSASGKVEVLAQAKNGKEAVEKALQLKPDVVLMDIGIPIMNGVEATKKILQEDTDIKVLALSMYENKEYIKDILDAGASGYILKNSPFDQLLSAILSVSEGNKYLSKKVTDIIIQDYLTMNKGRRALNQLSERELEVLKLYAEGKTSSEIAEQLFISVKTVGTHKQHLLKKLKLKTNADIIKFAIKEGLVSGEI